MDLVYIPREILRGMREAGTWPAEICLSLTLPRDESGNVFPAVRPQLRFPYISFKETLILWQLHNRIGVVLCGVEIIDLVYRPFREEGIEHLGFDLIDGRQRAVLFKIE